ncbi:hypothetical protein O1611_g2591 [Lasiodiplodia mahajangana]|uniref:Uncharacterized protein n=1 Tax=Lasiodiplodia mahajangana TaxID=1108764 RepID=A0ACC2JUH6_9PEZI|nr:hypothetical protein O1611_g2591 [Lasiodiplodia mahajangana]
MGKDMPASPSTNKNSPYNEMGSPNEGRSGIKLEDRVDSDGIIRFINKGLCCRKPVLVESSQPGSTASPTAF